MKKTLLLITLSTLLFSSCQKKGTTEPVSGEVTFNFSHKESYTRAEPEVKEGEISDINIFLYDETGRLSQWKYSDQVENSITLEFDTEREYSIYVLANVGDLTSDRAVSTVNGICGLYASFNDISSIVNQSGGIPMAAYIPQEKLSDGDTDRSNNIFRILDSGAVNCNSSVDKRNSCFDVFSHNCKGSNVHYNHTHIRGKLALGNDSFCSVINKYFFCALRISAWQGCNRYFWVCIEKIV